MIFVKYTCYIIVVYYTVHVISIPDIWISEEQLVVTNHTDSFRTCVYKNTEDISGSGEELWTASLSYNNNSYLHVNNSIGVFTPHNQSEVRCLGEDVPSLLLPHRHEWPPLESLPSAQTRDTLEIAYLNILKLKPKLIHSHDTYFL